MAATVVHHKIAISAGGEKLQLENLESSCREHHEQIHGRGPSEQKKQWDTFQADQRRKQF